MSKIDDGGPAFSHYNHEGMSLRDYFAAKAMQSVIAKYDASSQPDAGKLIARISYAMADAMLAERKEGK